MTTRADSPSEARLPSDGAGPARLIVCERLGHWAVALRRELTLADLPLDETRSLNQCWEVLAGHPASFVVVELTRANLGSLLDRLIWCEREFPLAGVAAVAQRSLASCRWLLREAGVLHFVTSPRGLKLLAELARRHLDQAPKPQLELTERIWSSLPWGRRQ